MHACTCVHAQLQLVQVEFYFSDANLPTDKKLLKQVKKDPSGSGEACTQATMHGSTTNPAACFTVTCCTWMTCPCLVAWLLWCLHSTCQAVCQFPQDSHSHQGPRHHCHGAPGEQGELKVAQGMLIHHRRPMFTCSTLLCMPQRLLCLALFACENKHCVRCGTASSCLLRLLMAVPASITLCRTWC